MTPDQAAANPIADLYDQLANLQDIVAKYQITIDNLTGQMESLENWRTALRMRVRSERTTIL